MMVAVVATTLGLASPSHAANGAGHRDGSAGSALAAGTATYSSTANGPRASVTVKAEHGTQEITCTLTASTPFVYHGGPYGGGQQGIASVRCTGVVYSIQVETALFRYGTQVTYNTRTAYSTTFANADSVYPRSPGEYMTGADAYITWTYGGGTSFIPLTFSPVAYL